YRVAAGAAERPRQKIDRLVTPASRENVCGGDRVQLRQALDEHPRLRLRVAVESGVRVVVRVAPGQLVGMQPLEGRLPRGMLVGLQRHDVRPRELLNPAHGALPLRGVAAFSDAPPSWSTARAASRRVTAAPCASSPSSRARATATGPRERRPSGESSCTVIRLTKS